MARSVAGSSQGNTAVIGKGAQVRGRISGDGDLRVEGGVSGEVAVKGNLSVVDGAEVTADVQAASVLVEGVIEGDINATDAVTIRATARVSGAIRGASISIQEGASVSGKIEADFELPAEISGTKGRSAAK
jgi:cytoskeletal protein CcmA (bactofilin family)